MTTDWTKQAEEMVKNWTSVQQKVMESMMGMMGMSGATTASPLSKEMWDKTVETWHNSMKSALETQVTWTQFLADSVASNTGANQQLADMSRQTVDMMKQWADTQMKVLDTWLAEVKKVDPATMTQSMKPEDMLKSFQSWQEAGRKMMETQMEMMRNLTAARDSAAKK